MNENEELDKEKTLFEIFFDYVVILLKYKKFIISSTVVAAILAVIFSIVSLKLDSDISPLPNQYKAYAIVLFQENSGSSGMAFMLSAFGMDSSNSTTSISELAIHVLQSRSFIDKAVDEFDIIEKYKIENHKIAKSRKAVVNNSEYSYNRDTGALTIAYTDTDPVFAANLVNYEVEQLGKWFHEQGVLLRSNELSQMEEKINELAKEISDIENNIKSFQKEHGVLDIMEIAAIQTAMIADLRTSLNQVELEINDYSEYSNIEDPALVILKNQRSHIIDQINRIEEGYTSSDGREIPSIEDLPQLALDFSHMQAEHTLKSQLYQTLSERYEVTKLSASGENLFNVYEYAEIPEEKIGPSRGRLCIVTTFLVYLFSIVIALIHNSIKNLNLPR